MNEQITSQGTKKAQTIEIVTLPDGTRRSVTRHYRVYGEQLVANAAVVGGRGTQAENGERKPWEKGKRARR